MPETRTASEVTPSLDPDRRAAQSPAPQLSFIAIIGALSGAAFFGLLCLVALPGKQSIFTVSARALSYTAASGAAGTAVVAILWAVLRPDVRPAPPAFMQAAAEACVLLPSIVLLQIKQSLWMLGCAALATVIFWRGIHPLAQSATLTTRPEPDAPKQELAAIFGLPVEKRPMHGMIFLAVSVQLAAIAAAAGFLGWGSFLLSVWLLTMLWRWAATQPQQTVAPPAGWRQFLGITGLAVLLTIVFLLPPRHGGAGAPVEANSRAADQAARHRDIGDGYAGIILLPPPVKKTKIIAPKPRTSLFAAGHSEPLLIPFDGAYWYFKAPARRPSGRAHVAQGRATEVNVRSSDRSPLLMEAHQSLGAPIGLDCCREIEVALTNADTRPGTIAVGVILTDSTTPARPHQSLGMKPIASSEPAEIPAGREPVEETLRFAIPPGLKQCDEITVIFMPSRERERIGAKVSVRSFALLPR